MVKLPPRGATYKFLTMTVNRYNFYPCVLLAARTRHSTNTSRYEGKLLKYLWMQHTHAFYSWHFYLVCSRCRCVKANVKIHKYIYAKYLYTYNTDLKYVVGSISRYFAECFDRNITIISLSVNIGYYINYKIKTKRNVVNKI